MSTHKSGQSGYISGLAVFDTQTGCYTFIGNLTSPYRQVFWLQNHLLPLSSLPMPVNTMELGSCRAPLLQRLTGSSGSPIPSFCQLSCQRIICSLYMGIISDIIHGTTGHCLCQPFEKIVIFLSKNGRYDTVGVNSTVIDFQNLLHQDFRCYSGF